MKSINIVKVQSDHCSRSGFEVYFHFKRLKTKPCDFANRTS